MNRKDKLTLLAFLALPVIALPAPMYAVISNKIYTSDVWLTVFVSYFIYLSITSVAVTILGARREKKILATTNLTSERMFAEAITMAAYYTRHALITSDIANDNVQELLGEAREILNGLNESFGAKPETTSSYHRQQYSKYSMEFNDTNYPQ